MALSEEARQQKEWWGVEQNFKKRGKQYRVLHKIRGLETFCQLCYYIAFHFSGKIANGFS